MRTRIWRGIGLICAVCMLLSCTTPCFAADGGLAFDMDALGITSGMNAGAREDEFVHRDEFAQMVVNMMKQQTTAASLGQDDHFSDIADSQYKGAINLLAQMGYISGAGNGAFVPDAYISYAAACKILVYALGYNVIVQDQSLLSYMSIASAIGVTKGVDSTTEALTFRQAMMLISNALDIGRMVPKYYNGSIVPSYEVDENNTFRSTPNGSDGTETLKMRGVITADVSTYLYAPVTNLRDTQIEIDNKVYDFAGKAPHGYVGQAVEYYVSKDAYGEEIITALAPIRKNVVYDFAVEQVDKLSSSGVEFLTDKNVVQKVNFNSSTRYIYNNRLVLDYNPAKLDTNQNAVLRTVDNNDDGVAEVLFVYVYTDCIVENVFEDTKTVVLKEQFKFGTEKNLKLDEEDLTYEIYTSDGNLTDFSAITKDCVLSIARSNLGDIIRLVVGKEAVTGTVVSKSDKYVTIDNTSYLCTNALQTQPIKLGIQVQGYVNFMNMLVHCEEVKQEHTYGYVYLYGKDPTRKFGNYQIKMLIPQFVSVKTVEGETDSLSGEVSTSKSLFVRNKDVVVYEAENDIIFNGSKVKADLVLPQVIDQPVAYKFNSNGKISTIDTLEGVDNVKITAGTNGTKLNGKKYNGTELLFGGAAGEAFGIRENYTVAFCVPKYQEKGQDKNQLSDDDLKVYMELTNNVQYDANGYEMDEYSSIADVLVVQRVMHAGQLGAITGTSKVGLVKKVSNELNDDGTTELLKITMLADGKEQTFTVSPLLAHVEIFGQIAAGDLISYSLDGFDDLNAAAILQRHNGYYEQSEEEGICAYISDIQYGKVSNGRIRWVNNIMVKGKTDTSIFSTLELLVKNPAPIFVIEENDDVRIGSISDLQIGDMIYAALYVDDVRAIVIKR